MTKKWQKIYSERTKALLTPDFLFEKAIKPKIFAICKIARKQYGIKPKHTLKKFNINILDDFKRRVGEEKARKFCGEAMRIARLVSPDGKDILFWFEYIISYIFIGKKMSLALIRLPKPFLKTNDFGEKELFIKIHPHTVIKDVEEIWSFVENMQKELKGYKARGEKGHKKEVDINGKKMKQYKRDIEIWGNYKYEGKTAKELSEKYHVDQSAIYKISKTIDERRKKYPLPLELNQLLDLER